MKSARDYNINDISMFNIEYLILNKVQMHGGAIRNSNALANATRRLVG